MNVTLDLDDPTVFEIVRAWHTVKETCPRIKGRISSGGSGVHIDGSGYRGSFEQSIEIRRMAGDDTNRIKFDMETTRKPKQILFGRKGGREASVWFDNLESLVDAYERNTGKTY